MTARKRSVSKRAKPDVIAMTAADALLSIVSEIHIAVGGTSPSRLTIGQRTVILGFLQDARDTLPVLMEALAEIATATRPETSAGASA